MNVLVEGIGSMVFNPQLEYYSELGWNLTGIDIDNKSYGLYKIPKPYIIPKYSDENCFKYIEDIIQKEKLDLIFPTINEGLLEWSEKKSCFLEKYNTKVIISDNEVIDKCTDKWKTYEFFCGNNIPTPKTSLSPIYDLIKPRVGRGSVGISLKKDLENNFDMKGYISQEIVEGEEYTVDILCDLKSNPIYIIPRKRLRVDNGVSTIGMTVEDIHIIEYCKRIVGKLKPIGIINIQCFKDGEDIYFIEINPRIAGGSSLSFAASDNWFKAIECFVNEENYVPKEIRYNMYMFRSYEDLIISKEDLI